MQLEILTGADLQKFKEELFDELRQIYLSNPSLPEGRKWLRSAEVRKMLNISPGTLQNFRINNTLPFKKVGKIIYYAYSDIERLMGEEVRK